MAANDALNGVVNPVFSEEEAAIESTTNNSFKSASIQEDDVHMEIPMNNEGDFCQHEDEVELDITDAVATDTQTDNCPPPETTCVVNVAASDAPEYVDIVTASVPAGETSSTKRGANQTFMRSVSGGSFVDGRPESVEAIDLHYEVEERGQAWWEKLSQFQMPWTWCRRQSQQRKQILKGVNFRACRGEMLAVLGSSGSGKTTLLDVVACQAEGGRVSGSVTIGGMPMTRELVRNCTAYVRQDDRLLPHLTVMETLSFVARLKLPKTWSNDKMNQKVESVVAELGLRHVADTKVGGSEVRGVSGGERRRVTIGLQLLVDPGVLFLDEPTSGLDSFTAHYLVETLRTLAANNRIVILTIHQPRSDIFELFDLLMLLSRGKVVYYGKANHMVDYFSTIGYPCPELTNPCDHYVDLSTVDMKTIESEQTTNERLESLVQLYDERSAQTRAETADISSCVMAEDKPQDSTLAFTTSVDSQRPGAVTQFSVLSRRALRNNLEDYGFLTVQAVEAAMMSLTIGLIYYNLGLNQLSARDRFGLLYCISALYPYMVILDVIGKYYKERHTLYLEMLDGLYTAAPYFFGKILTDMPEHTLFIFLYAIPVYFLSGLQMTAIAFFQFLAIVYMLVLCSRSMGLFAGAMMPTYQLSVITAQLLFTIFLLSSGFIFNLDNIFVGVKWTSYISYIKWGYQALCQTEMTGLNFTCPNYIPDSACISTGQEALLTYSLEGGSFWASFLFILGEILLFQALFFIGIRFKSQKPHQA